MLKVDILSWEKFNPRNDRTNHVWFRFQNNFFENQKLFELSPTDRIIFIFILCTASKNGRSDVEISVPFISALLKLGQDEIIKSLHTLAKIGVITTSESRQLAVNKPSKGIATIQDNTIQDNTEPESTTSHLMQETLTLAKEFTKPKTMPVVSKATPVIVETSQQLISKIPRITLERWSVLYNEPEFLQREMLKALNYYEANPRKLPKTVKGWSQALSSWFSRAWEWRAKSTKGVAPTGKVDIDSILKGLENDKE